jgi:hypothetical protein
VEENRVNFCMVLDGKPLFNTLYSMYIVTLNDLRAVLKVGAQAGRSRGVNEASVESTAQDDFQEVKRHERRYSDDTS